MFYSSEGINSTVNLSVSTQNVTNAKSNGVYLQSGTLKSSVIEVGEWSNANFKANFSIPENCGLEFIIKDLADNALYEITSAQASDGFSIAKSTPLSIRIHAIFTSNGSVAPILYMMEITGLPLGISMNRTNWTYYYYGGAAIGLVLLVCCCCCCKKRRKNAM
jgi:hypothetical protein